MCPGTEGENSKLVIFVTDKDEGENAKITVSLVSGDQLGNFSVTTVGNKTVLSTVGALDREYKDNYKLVLKAVDNGSPQVRTATCEVLVTVLDINDETPRFAPATYTGSVAEGSENGTLVVVQPELNVIDKDGDSFGRASVRFSLNKNKDVPFTIDPQSGDITVSGVLDRETTAQYNLTVIAQDDYGNGLQGSAQVTITLTDINDMAPNFLAPHYYFDVAENSEQGSYVGDVYAEDPDEDSSKIIYLLKDTTQFSLNITGTLSVIGNLDRETKDSYKFRVFAFDGENTGEAWVHINVTDINDNPPLLVKNKDLILQENQTAPFVVGTLNATDQDLGPNGKVSFYLNRTEEDSFFEISEGGQLSLVKPLSSDAKKLSSLSLTGYIMDAGRPPLSSLFEVEVRIVQMNNYVPQICYNGTCNVSLIVLSVTDGSEKGTVLGHVLHEDQDGGEEGQVTFSLSHSNSTVNEYFSIDKNGIMKLEKRLSMANIEKFLESREGLQNVLPLVLTATDNGTNALSSSATVLIHIMGSSANAPRFLNASYILTVKENLSPGALVGQVKAVSPSNLTLVYGMGEENVPFNISSQNGTVFTTQELDRESTPNYHFIVSATDKSQVKTLALVEVTVTDVNDWAPEFTDIDREVYVAENTLVPSLTVIHAVDRDEGLNAEITYRFLNESQYPQFVLNDTTGVLSVEKELDREEQASYTLWFQAENTKAEPQQNISSTVSILVLVTDLNDNDPVFTNESYTVTFFNITSSNQEVLQVQATDKDNGVNGTVSYSLEHTRDYYFFSIEPLSGILRSTQSLDKDLYEVTVTATDFGTPHRSKSANVTLEKLNETKILPSLSLSESSSTLFVGMPPGTVLGVKITSTFAERVVISGGNEEDLFEVDENSQGLKLKKALEKISTYTLTITAISKTAHTASEKYEVDVRELAFVNENMYVTIRENTDAPQNLQKLSSNAAAEGFPVSYSLDSETDTFSLDTNSGMLTLQHSVDREKQATYVLDVSVSLQNCISGAKPGVSCTGNAKVIVRVEDVNDNVPSFGTPGSELIFKVGNVTVNYLVTTIKAFDPDEGLNGDVHYTIVSGNEEKIFSLDTTSGELRVIDPSKLSTLNDVKITIAATDRAGDGQSSTLDVKVLVVRENDEYLLTAPVDLTTFDENVESITRQLSDILNFELILSKTEVHSDDKKSDPSRTDIFFTAVDPKTNQTLPVSEIQRRVSDNQEAINKVFSSMKKSKQTVSQDDGYSATTIALITVAGFMFLAAFIAILISIKLWKVQKAHQMKEQSAANARKKMEEQTANGKPGSVSDPDEHLEMRIMSNLDTETDLDDGVHSSVRNGSISNGHIRSNGQISTSAGQSRSTEPVETSTGNNGGLLIPNGGSHVGQGSPREDDIKNADDASKIIERKLAQSLTMHREHVTEAENESVRAQSDIQADTTNLDDRAELGNLSMLNPLFVDDEPEELTHF